MTRYLGLRTPLRLRRDPVTCLDSGPGGTTLTVSRDGSYPSPWVRDRALEVEPGSGFPPSEALETWVPVDVGEGSTDDRDSRPEMTDGSGPVGSRRVHTLLCRGSLWDSPPRGRCLSLLRRVSDTPPPLFRLCLGLSSSLVPGVYGCTLDVCLCDPFLLLRSCFCLWSSSPTQGGRPSPTLQSLHRRTLFPGYGRDPWGVSSGTPPGRSDSLSTDHVQ